jgi:hypothetical protein
VEGEPGALGQAAAAEAVQTYAGRGGSAGYAKVVGIYPPEHLATFRNSIDVRSRRAVVALDERLRGSYQEEC